LRDNQRNIAWGIERIEMTSRGDLDDLADFAAVARARSFTRAAADLRVSTSALSHAVKALEARLGVRLLHRNSRSVSVTAAGERLLNRLEPALSEIGSALETLGLDRDVVAGAVRITTTRYAFETIVRPVLPQYLATYPLATVEVSIDYELRDIVAERFDAGIRLGEKLEEDMVSVRVGPDLRMAVVAAPVYLARHSVPETPDDLRGHRCVNYRLMSSGGTYDWEFERDGRTISVKVDGPLTFNEPELMMEAALDGLGVAYVLEDRAAPLIADGRLVRLLEPWTLPFAGYFLYYSSRRQIPPTLAALIAALRPDRPSISPAGLK
jgi:DNA-binding transcriptional LysR family regulator